MGTPTGAERIAETGALGLLSRGGGLFFFFLFLFFERSGRRRGAMRGGVAEEALFFPSYG